MNKWEIKFLNKLKERKGNNYELLGEYKGANTKTLFRHNKCQYEWYVTPGSLLYNKYGCPNCSKNAKLTTSTFVERVKSMYNGLYSVLGEYKNAHTKIELKCRKCSNSFFITPSDLFSGRGCPTCAFTKRRSKVTKTDKKFKTEVFNLVGNDYKVLGEYYNWKTKIKFKHVVCGYEFYIEPNSFLQGRRCPLCNRSYGEKAIEDYLKENNIIYEPQKKFKGLKYKRHLSYDFYLPDFSILIEYQGKQHYEPVGRFGGEDNFIIQKERDLLKKSYALDNNMLLIEIKYTYNTKDKIYKYLDNIFRNIEHSKPKI